MLSIRDYDKMYSDWKCAEEFVYNEFKKTIPNFSEIEFLSKSRISLWVLENGTQYKELLRAELKTLKGECVFSIRAIDTVDNYIKSILSNKNLISKLFGIYFVYKRIFG